MAKNYTVGDKTFTRKQDIKSEISRILANGPVGSEIGEGDLLFVKALLAQRDEKIAEIGDREIIRIVRDWQPGFKRTRCFWVVFSDGTKLDFSVYKSVRLLQLSVAFA